MDQGNIGDGAMDWYEVGYGEMASTDRSEFATPGTMTTGVEVAGVTAMSAAQRQGEDCDPSRNCHEADMICSSGSKRGCEGELAHSSFGDNRDRYDGCRR